MTVEIERESEKCSAFEEGSYLRLIGVRSAPMPATSYAAVCPILVIDSGLIGRLPREQKMLKGHLPRVVHHQVHQYTKKIQEPSAQPPYDVFVTDV